jgi:predicted MPP superfamily phosphohydrolase
MEELTWLHVSDFHFEAGEDRFGQDLACRALIEDVKDRQAEHGSLACVLVTGDIAYSGRPEEYAQARTRLAELADATAVAPERFFFVPGNHDVDRRAHDFAHAGAVHLLSSQQEVDRALGNPARMVDLLARQDAYRDFVGDFTAGQESQVTEDGLAYVAVLHDDPLNIAIVGLNSAWLSGGDGEATSLIVGERQLVNALSIAREQNPHLVLAMAHHPVEWLRDWDQRSCRDRLYKATHLFHRGHMHDPDVTTSPHRQCIVVAAGAAHAGRFYANSYNIVSVNLATGLATIQAFDYVPDQRLFAPREPVLAPCQLGGELDCSAADLAAALKAVMPAETQGENYLSALILGQKDEIPIQIEGEIEFVPSETALKADPDQSAAAGHFLALRHLLRIRHEGESLQEQLAKHSDVVQAYCRQLTEYCERDDDCRHRVTGAPLMEEIHPDPATTRPQTIALLEELASGQDWSELETQASRHIGDPDQRLARVAKSHLAQALMHSDEQPKREEAALLSEHLVATGEPTTQDYLLAAGAYEAAGIPPRSIELITEALGVWPADPYLLDYARGLATRTGDPALRSLADPPAGVSGR